MMLGRAPPILKPISAWQAGREARKLAYVVVLLEEAHVDPKKILPGDVVFSMLSPYEQRGFTERSIEAWVSECDPMEKPPWDSAECFRAKARAAMKPRPGLGTKVALIAGASFLAAFSLSRWRK
jgi:hypothetical protein